jgi:chitinase
MKWLKCLFLVCVLFWANCVIAKHIEKNYVVVAYVTSWTRYLPDPTVMTHINYAFGHVNESFNGVNIDNPERLRTIIALKQQNPKLRVLLSIGGWGSGHFSEMAASKENREVFAFGCKRIVEAFDLDGIDIDWEYPTQSVMGTSASPEDTENFTLLVSELRKVLGTKCLITAATIADAKFIDFKESIKYLDFINVMAYDMGNGRNHHSALYRSQRAGHLTCDEAVMAHLKEGVPAEKLVFGMAFYGRGNQDSILHDFVKTHYTGGKYFEHWDEVAQVPYISNEKGEFVFGYDNPHSLAIKCKYIIDHQLHGGMYWEYGDDDSQGDDRQTLFLSLMKNKKATVPPRKIFVVAERGDQHEAFTAAALKWLASKAVQMNLQLTVVNSAQEIKRDEIPQYHLILQLNYPPYAWSEAAQQDFEDYVDHGYGSYIGFHHASLLGDFDGFPLWRWFSDFMGGIRYKSYIAATADAIVQVEDKTHPIMKGVPDTFIIGKDEWYTYDQNPRSRVHVLAHVDEDSYSPPSTIKMGDHPVIWVNSSKKARNVYFQFGHSASLFSNAAFLKMFENALRWGLYDK